MSIQAINVRNQFKGKVREIIRGDVVSEVDVETAWGIVTSVITTRSVDELQLKPGSDVVALVKSTEVSIAKLRGPNTLNPSSAAFAPVAATMWRQQGASHGRIRCERDRHARCTRRATNGAIPRSARASPAAASFPRARRWPASSSR